jgi:DNA-binding MarR family transcriptional regulator
MSKEAQAPDLGILVGLAYQTFVEELRDDLEARGVAATGRSDGVVFRVLADSPVNISELARQLGISKQGAAQIVDDMASRHLVARTPDPADGRSRLVTLTEQGAEALEAARRFHRQYERRLVAALGADDVATLRRTLSHMARGAEVRDARIRALYL